MMLLTAPTKLEAASFSLPKNINSLPNGLFRANLVAAPDLMPELAELFLNCPVQESRHEWEVDVKIHMLMPNQYPCIPNWHCDNVLRVGGKLDYRETFSRFGEPNQKMFLWLSGTPCTEFLKQDLQIDSVPSSHQDLIEIMNLTSIIKQNIEPQHWYSFDRVSPHRGVVSKENTWRIFVRLTHQSITPIRPKGNAIRRHSQVYLDAATFGW